MSTSAGSRLAVLLAAQDEVSASVQLAAMPAADLQLDVDGMGRVPLPISAAKARQLRGLGRPARYGRGEQTLTDTAVRDTWEIPAELVHAQWSSGQTLGHGLGDGLGPALDVVREELGLPAGCRLTAQLHSLLVYDTGQFFLPHQDSEKDDTMIATLVVMLPSAHAGGELVVHHAGEATTYRGSTTSLCLVAFYTDCRHEVRPVTSGHRIVLTYDLLLHGDPQHRTTDEAIVGQVAACLDEHFTTAVRDPYRNSPGQPRRRLAFLLDHEYTEHGLHWTRLKGTDSSRGALLHAAADAAGCEAVLALTEIQETWDAEETGPDRGYRRHSGGYRDRYWDEDEDGDDLLDDADEDDDEDRYVVNDLIDSSIRLTWWTDESAEAGEAISLSLSDSEVCAATPSGDLRPYSSHYEGYMGNWGNTLDRWYRRAAVLVWPRDRGFVNRAEASPARALDELVARASSRADGPNAGDPDADDLNADGPGRASVRAAAASLEPLWDSIIRGHDQSRSLLGKSLTAALAVDDPALAAMLLHPFAVEQVRPAHAPRLAELAGRYGDRWTAELLRRWFSDEYGRRGLHDPTRSSWLTGLPDLCTALYDSGDHGSATAQQLLERAWAALTTLFGSATATPALAQRREQLAALAEPLAAALLSTSALSAEAAQAEAAEANTLQANALRDTIVSYCREHGEGLGPCVIAALRVTVTTTGQAPTPFAPIAADQADRLQARLARPTRAPDDWTVPLPRGCTCPLCTTLEAFLADPAQRTRDWPLAQDRRSHVHARIDQADLPVTHQTRRQGRPYVLVLTKTDRLFTREAQQRAQDQTDLRWLLDHWPHP